MLIGHRRENTQQFCFASDLCIAVEAGSDCIFKEHTVPLAVAFGLKEASFQAHSISHLKKKNQQQKKLWLSFKTFLEVFCV